MYTVKEWHCRPTYRRGDLEAEEVVINVTTFKTRKAAKEFIENKLRGKRDDTHFLCVPNYNADKGAVPVMLEVERK